MQQNEVIINNLAVLRQQMENHFLAKLNRFLLMSAWLVATDEDEGAKPC